MEQMLFGEDRLTGRSARYIFWKAWKIPIFGYHIPRWVLVLIYIFIFRCGSQVKSLSEIKPKYLV